MKAIILFIILLGCPLVSLAQEPDSKEIDVPLNQINQEELNLQEFPKVEESKDLEESQQLQRDEYPQGEENPIEFKSSD